MQATRRTFLTMAGVAITAAGLAACAPTTTSPSASPTPTPTAAALDADALESVFQSAFAASGVAGAAARVRFGGQEWSSTAGVADLETQAPLMRMAQDDSRLLVSQDPGLTSPRGKATRTLLYLMERDAAVGLLRSG